MSGKKKFSLDEIVEVLSYVSNQCSHNNCAKSDCPYFLDGEGCIFFAKPWEWQLGRLIVCDVTAD